MNIRHLVVALTIAVAGSPASGQTSSPSDLDRVKAGAAAPDFELPEAGGGKLALSDLLGKTVVLVFYRGYW